MTSRRPRRALLLLVGAAAHPLLAGGCVRFGAEPPARLITIASDASVPIGTALTGSAATALVIDDPLAARALQNTRVAVNDGPNAIAYVKDALWADTPPRQFRRLLAETISARTGRLVLTPGQFVSDPTRQLKGELIAFGVDARRGLAVVTFDATLLSTDGATIARQRFSATAPVGTIDPATVAAPISRAANQVAEQVADWLKTQR